MKRGSCLLLGLVGACAKVLGFDDGRLEGLEDRPAGGMAFSDPSSAGASDEGGAGSGASDLGGAPGGGGAPEAGGGLGGAWPRCGDENLDAGEECDGDQLG